MDVERISLNERAARFAALGDPMRLAIIDALSLSDLSPKELQAQLDVASNLVAHHLSVLEGVGLIERVRSEGDRRRSYVRLNAGALDGVMPETSADARRVVFVCTANSARSQLAAALWAARSEIPAVSAGTDPAESIAPGAIRVAERRGLTLLTTAPVSLDSVARADDFVITVCDSAHEELPRTSLHWSIPDPVRENTDGAFDAAYEAISSRVDDLAPRLRRAS